MNICINNLLSKEEVGSIIEYVENKRPEFVDGGYSAGGQARKAKNNRQLPTQFGEPVLQKARNALGDNLMFQFAARPKCFARMVVSSYQVGMTYGWHVDNAVMDGHRTDLSFTLFLSDPESYGGGELEIDEADGVSAFKLKPGSMVLYPTSKLHRVAPVTTGERLAIVGWVRSQVRSDQNREILFDLELALAQLRKDGIADETLNRLLKVRTDLLRQWVED